jgi:hypothetical protein
MGFLGAENAKELPPAERLRGAGLAKPRRLIERHSIGFVLRVTEEYNYRLFFFGRAQRSALAPANKIGAPPHPASVQKTEAPRRANR